MKRKTIVVCMLLLVATVLPVAGTMNNITMNNISVPLVWSQEAKLLASDGVANDQLGRSVSISGDSAILGAPYNEAGSAYVFIRDGTSWTEQAKLTSSDGAAGDKFGWSVSIDGDYAIVGSHNDDGVGGYDFGSAYVFKRDGTSWTEQAKLTASDGAQQDYFGWSVSIDGDYAIVGAYANDDNGSCSGSAYVFKRDGTSWTEQAKLTASDAAADDEFGKPVSISGDYAIVAARGNADAGSNTGSAYVFKRTDTTWAEEAKLTASDAAAGDCFGSSVSISGNYAIAGARRDDDISGSAYVFKRTDTTWAEEAKLIASDAEANDQFGCSVSIDGNYTLIGAERNSDSGRWSGSAYVFKRTDTTWAEEAKLIASDGAAYEYFGCSVSISGNYALVGVWADNDNGVESGSAYVFTTESSPNNPPYVPADPDPEDDVIDVDINVDLSWTGGDPDPGDTVTYDVYFGTTSPPPKVVSNQSGTSYDPGIMDPSTLYYWQIVAWDNHGVSTAGSIWRFTTRPNHPPNTPGSPNPGDGATDVGLNIDLSWIGGDSDPGDTVTYDVYFGKTSSPPKIISNQSSTIYDPGTLDYEAQYYWKIVSWDNHGASTAGPIWGFTTEVEPEPQPDLDCDGDLNWIDVEPGSTVTGEFTVSNVGEDGSLLDWEIESYPDWGTWTFTPMSGTGLTPEGSPVTVQVEVVAPDESETEFTGEVKIVNSEDSDDYCIISAKLVTPVNQNAINLQAFQILQRVIQRFPILEWVFSYFFRVIEVRNC